MQRKNKLTRWFVYEWGKPPRQKPHRVILRSPLPRIHYYHNKQLQVKESQYLIPTYSWTLTPIHNWTCSVVTISHFQCTAPSTWLTNQCADSSTRLNHQLEKDDGLQSSSIHQHDEDHEAPWSQNPIATKRSSFFKRKMNFGKFCFRSQFAWTKLCSILAQPLTALKIILIYV